MGSRGLLGVSSQCNNRRRLTVMFPVYIVSHGPESVPCTYITIHNNFKVLAKHNEVLASLITTPLIKLMVWNATSRREMYKAHELKGEKMSKKEMRERR